jgi:Na+/H+ antiporter NhaD/arsenite permease-like protein
MSDQLDPVLWKYGLTVMATLMGVIIISAAVVANTYFKSSPEHAAKGSNEFLKSQSSTRLLTVLLVVSAACVLSIFHVLNDGAVAILSGITGYVLGGLPAVSPSNDKSPEKSKDTDNLPGS